jgi:hypothetical protein
MTAPTGYLCNWGASTALEALLAAPTWLGLHSDDPTPLGNPSSELIGGGYARQPIAFAAAAARGKVSVNAQVFSGLLEGEVGWLAVWTAVSSGHGIYVIELDEPILITDSGQFRCAVGDVALAF